jgi:hypothetical protein
VVGVVAGFIILGLLSLAHLIVGLFKRKKDLEVESPDK